MPHSVVERVVDVWKRAFTPIIVFELSVIVTVHSCSWTFVLLLLTHDGGKLLCFLKYLRIASRFWTTLVTRLCIGWLLRFPGSRTRRPTKAKGPKCFGSMKL